MTLYIYGSSDDLIEVGGDIYEEFNVYHTEGFVGLSNGVVLNYRYNGYNGDWWFNVHNNPAKVPVEVKSNGENEKCDYSQLVVVEGSPVEWVMVGEIRL